MSQLEDIILERYENGPELIHLIRRTNLEETLKKAFSAIESTPNPTELIPLSGKVLISINSKIQSLNNPDKESIEYILADLFKLYLEKIARSSNGKDILSKITNDLKLACEINNYNFASLVNLLNLEEGVVLLPQRRKNDSVHYLWLTSKSSLDDIAKDIQDKKWIISAKEFKKLFEPIKGNLQVRCNPEFRVHLIILFHILKEKKYIEPKGISGHFAPFAHYAMVNEKYLFEKKGPNRVHENFKRNKEKYEKQKAKIEELISKNIRK